jgi:hypothetical protein
MIVKKSQSAISVRTGDIIFPVDSLELAVALAQNNYQITTRIPTPPPAAGTPLEIFGELARKGP